MISQLNTAAKTLLASQPSSDEDEDDDDELNAVAVANVRGGSPKGDRSSSPWVKVEPPKRHTIHVDNPNQQANAQLRRSLEFSSNSSSPSRDRRASESTLLVCSDNKINSQHSRPYVCHYFAVGEIETFPLTESW